MGSDRKCSLILLADVLIFTSALGKQEKAAWFTGLPRRAAQRNGKELKHVASNILEYLLFSVWL